MNIIALDVAKKLGIAILDKDSLVVYTIEGSPLFQISKILPLVTKDTIIVIEDFSYFSTPNPITTATLNQRLGYIFWRLKETGVDINLYNVNTVRKYLGVSSRKKGEQKLMVQYQINQESGIKFTNDETDAIALLLYHIRKQIGFLNKLCLQRLKPEKEKNVHTPEHKETVSKV